MRTFLVWFVLLAPATAVAQPYADPGFAQTDRTGASSVAGASVGMVSLANDAQGAYHVDAYGQWMLWRALGAYGAVPLNVLTTDDESETALGNAELGAVWVPGGLPWTIIARGGVALPTAPADDVPAQFANQAGQLARFTDAALGQSGVTWARAAASMFLRDGQGFFRLDAGLDIALFGDRTDDVSHALRLNAAAGIESDKIALMAELITNVGLEDPGQADRFLHVLSLGGRVLSAGDFQPYVSFAVPLDDELRDFFGYALLAGVDYFLP